MSKDGAIAHPRGWTDEMKAWMNLMLERGAEDRKRMDKLNYSMTPRRAKTA